MEKLCREQFEELKAFNIYFNEEKAVDSKFSADVESILGVIFGSFGPITKSKESILGQQALQGSFGLTLAFGSLSSKGTRSPTNPSEEGSSVAENIKKTLALLDLSGSKNSSMKKDYDISSDGSSSLTAHELSYSNIIYLTIHAILQHSRQSCK
ncbi:hypothetical protein RND71_023102 [Anisodus tanguticus]|uniref:Uncharacterized protein n=1 Tax=Anisodus tanguticus TaxID=243964 RepID=A0AAE1RU61_9SOLA|nr:hypothetical protein RND71_023102 [Anisodus tanguticus]